MTTLPAGAIKIALAIVLVVRAFLGGSAWAVTPVRWQTSSREDFEKRPGENVAIHSSGTVTLSPTFDVFAETGEQSVWCLLGDRAGNLYAGTGNEGKILKIDSKGKVSVLFDSPEVGIHSLALGDDGDIYAGSSPDGIIYRISPNGEASTLCKTGQRYVWSLLVASGGDIYAGTGDKGKILRIAAGGAPKDFYKSSDGHVTCLLADGAGGIYAGTEGRGLVYRIDRQGNGFLLLDSAQREIRGFARGPAGTVYVAAMAGQGRSSEGQPGGGWPPPGVVKEPQSPQPAGKALAAPDQGDRDVSALYCIAPDGIVSPVWNVQEPLLFCMVAAGDSSLLVGVGENGVLHKVMPSTGKSMILGRIENAQPLSMFVDKAGAVFIGTGNAGKVHRMGAGYAEKGTLTLGEHDFGLQTQWGQVSWRGDTPEGANLTVQTRSGNVADADTTWSPWSDDLTSPEGSKIPSPAARFLQLRVMLSSKDRLATPSLQEITAVGLPANLRPVITSLISAPFRDGSKPPGQRGEDEGGGGAPPQQSGVPFRQALQVKNSLRTIKWQARDPNGDALTYALYVRGVDEKGWTLLDDDMKTTSYLWDTESAAEGTKILKITASDRPDNPDELALETEETSKPFDVDNTGPEVADLRMVRSGKGEVRIDGSASDRTSFLQKGDYSADGKDWRPFFPKDRIFDSKAEEFSFAVRDLPPGEHTIVARVYDGAGNSGAAKITFETE